MACGPFFVVLEIFECPLNVGRLLSFVAPAEEQYANSPEHHVIDPVAGPPINPQFAQALAQRSAVAKIPRLRSGIRQSGPPVIEHIFPSAVDIMTSLDHGPHCNL